MLRRNAMPAYSESAQEWMRAGIKNEDQDCNKVGIAKVAVTTSLQPTQTASKGRCSEAPRKARTTRCTMQTTIPPRTKTMTRTDEYTAVEIHSGLSRKRTKFIQSRKKPMRCQRSACAEYRFVKNIYMKKIFSFSLTDLSRRARISIFLA